LTSTTFSGQTGSWILTGFLTTFRLPLKNIVKRGDMTVTDGSEVVEADVMLLKPTGAERQASADLLWIPAPPFEPLRGFPAILLLGVLA